MGVDGSRGFGISTGHSKFSKSNWTVYILELNDKTYYTGITNNLDKRLAAHNSGNGSKYVRSRLPFRVIYKEYATNRSSASQREVEIKKMSKSNKEMLVEKDNKIFLVCNQCFASLALSKEDCPEEFTIECICYNLVNYKE